MYPTAAALRARGDTSRDGGNTRREPGEGAFVTARAVRRAADVIQPHLVSNTLWAFSVLRYKPGAALMRAFDDLVEARVEDYTDQSLSMTVFAYANLAFEPKPETLAKLVAQCETRVVAGGFTPQGLSNSFWGWAVLGASSPRLPRMSTPPPLPQPPLPQLPPLRAPPKMRTRLTRRRDKEKRTKGPRCVCATCARRVHFDEL